MSGQKIRVLLVDDHEVVRVGLRSLVARERGMEVVGEAADAAEAVAQAARLRPDVVVMDVRLPDRSGVEACREIRSADPRVHVIMLTSYADEEAVFSSILAGASGYLLKDCAFEELDGAIRAVTQGRTYITPRIVDIIVKDYFSQVEKPSSSAVSSRGCSSPPSSRRRRPSQLSANFRLYNPSSLRHSSARRAPSWEICSSSAS